MVDKRGSSLIIHLDSKETQCYNNVQDILLFREGSIVTVKNRGIVMQLPWKRVALCVYSLNTCKRKLIPKGQSGNQRGEGLELTLFKKGGRNVAIDQKSEQEASK